MGGPALIRKLTIRESKPSYEDHQIFDNVEAPSCLIPCRLGNFDQDMCFQHRSRATYVYTEVVEDSVRLGKAYGLRHLGMCATSLARQIKSTYLNEAGGLPNSPSNAVQIYVSKHS